MNVSMDISDGITLNDGNKMAIFGLGTWALETDDAYVYNAVSTALKEGYRLFDTAAVYENETSVGKALKDSGLKRDEYFLVTKLSHKKHGYEESKAAFERSLARLGLDYVDLFLIHTPRPGRIVETWKALVDLKKEGKTKSIGVSNFSAEHLAGLMTHGMEKPAVNQIELHPLHQQETTLSYCRENNIAVMAYCPLIRCQYLEEGKIPVIDSIAAKENKTKAQVYLRWAVQNNTIVIPKSWNASRIKENAGIFDWSISDVDMKAIGTLDESLEICSSSGAMRRSWEFISNVDEKGMYVY